MNAYFETVPGACGVGVVCEFNHNNRYNNETIEHSVNPGGTGYICAGFIEGDSISDEAFSLMEKRGPCVFKTETRKNVNSDNQFYFAVFDWGHEDKFGFKHVDD